jgi:hypothetical protein
MTAISTGSSYTDDDDEHEGFIELYRTQANEYIEDYNGEDENVPVSDWNCHIRDSMDIMRQPKYIEVHRDRKVEKGLRERLRIKGRSWFMGVWYRRGRYVERE